MVMIRDRAVRLMTASFRATVSSRTSPSRSRVQWSIMRSASSQRPSSASPRMASASSAWPSVRKPNLPTLMPSRGTP